ARRGARAGALVAERADRDRRRRGGGEPASRTSRPDRRRRPCSRDGGAARPARPPRLLRADGRQRGAEPRLVDVRADRNLDRGRAFWGTGIGYFLPTLWCFGLGVLLVLSRNISDAADVPAAVVAGGAVSAFALLALTVDESDEAFADIYSTAVSIQNVLPRLSQRLLIVAVSAVATLGAIVIDLRSYQSFLLLLGSVFVPLFGVLLADWLLAGTHYRERDFFAGPAVRVEQLVAWVVGFALYQWLSPQGPSWWTSLFADL